MSSQTYYFTVLRARPNPVRGESVNVGIAVLDPVGVRLFIKPDLQRLKVFDRNLAALPWDDLRENAWLLFKHFNTVDSQHLALKTMIAPIYADDQLGQFVAENEVDFDAQVTRLLDRLVHRPARDIGVARAKRASAPSKLNTQLRNWFKGAHVFSSNVADISKQRVVANYPVAAKNDLYAEFALKNSVVHVIETLDLRGHDKVNAHVHKETAIKSIVLDQARHSLDKSSRRIAVVSATNYGAMQPVINIVETYANDIITMASAEDRQRLADFVAQSLHSQTALPALV